MNVETKTDRSFSLIRNQMQKIFAHKQGSCSTKEKTSITTKKNSNTGHAADKKTTEATTARPQLHRGMRMQPCPCFSRCRRLANSPLPQTSYLHLKHDTVLVIHGPQPVGVHCCSHNCCPQFSGLRCSK